MKIITFGGKHSLNRVAEICCGSLEDALVAEKAGADRIELNNAMFLSGLTPSLGTIDLVVHQCNISIVVMVRPRPGGFFYNPYEFETIVADVEAIAKYDIEGIAFGCLDENGNIDQEKNKRIIDLIHNYQKDAIFHRAFDFVNDPFESIEILIELGVKRVLTSGLKNSAMEGIELLRELEEKYGDKIDILVGGGVNSDNVSHFIQQTGIKQYHSSCTGWRRDPTTFKEQVSFSFAEPPHHEDYNIVDYQTAIKFVSSVKESGDNLISKKG